LGVRLSFMAKSMAKRQAKPPSGVSTQKCLSTPRLALRLHSLLLADYDTISGAIVNKMQVTGE
jgi:hypothetical protein